MPVQSLQLDSDELAERQARLAGIVNSIRDAIVSVDQAQQITLFNPAAEAMFGYPAKTMLGQPLGRLFPERFHGAHSAHVQRFGATGYTLRSMGGQNAIQWGRRASGEEFPLEAAISHIEIDGAKIYTAVIRDATERLRAEQELADGRLQLAGIVESAMDAIITVDEEQRIVLFNLRAQAMFGYPRADMLGQPLERLIPERFREVHEAHMQRFGDTDAPTRSRGLLTGIVALHANGSEFPIQASISLVTVSGRKFFTVILHDLTERRRSERALHESEMQFKRIVETSQEGIWLIDHNEVTTYVNPRMAVMLGYEVAEVVGQPLSKFVDTESFRLAMYHLERQRKEGVNLQLDFQFLRKDGSLIDVLIVTNAIKDESGYMGALAMCTDITERKRAEADRARLEEKFLQAQKMEAIGTLAGGIAHDFNNILSAIKGYGEMVLDVLPEDTPAREDQLEVLKAAERAGQLVRQILTFSRKKASERVPVSLPLMIKEVCMLMRATLPATIEVRQVIEEPAALVLADPIEIHQILVNLATNAGHAMQERGGILEMRLKRHVVEDGWDYGFAIEPGDYFQIVVSDTGVGMSSDVLARIFDPFFTTKEPGEGTGLGLSTVHGVVQSLGGRVSVYSEPGRGTTFDVSLPAAQGTEPEAVHAEIVHGTGRILFVDDEAALARLGTQILEKLGYTVDSFTSSVEALEQFKLAPELYDLIVSDETMPKLKGSELARQACEIWPDIAVILCTGYAHELGDMSPAVKVILHKPVSRSELSLAVSRVLAEQRKV